MVWVVVCKVLPKLARALPSLSAQKGKPKPGDNTNAVRNCKADGAGQALREPAQGAPLSSEARLRVIYRFIHLAVRCALSRRFIRIVL